MAVVSFKTNDEFKHKIEMLAQKNGINTSAYIKLILTTAVNGELVEVTENGLTIAEELAIKKSDAQDIVAGPFKSAKSLIRALKTK